MGCWAAERWRNLGRRDAFARTERDDQEGCGPRPTAVVVRLSGTRGCPLLAAKPLTLAAPAPHNLGMTLHMGDA
jgi:hypothetical protein